MSKQDLDKKTLYEGVKLLVESEQDHLVLPQQKLYTLFTLGFQYFLYLSTKKPGHYIIRVQDSYLLDKLERKAKEDVCRRFMTKLALPRKLKYSGSTFHLDFFHLSTWANTNDLPKEKIQGALIVKSASPAPLQNNIAQEEASQEEVDIMADLPNDYYVSSLASFVPKIVVVAFDEEFEGFEPIKFPFIKEEPKEKLLKGVSISSEINLDEMED